MNLANPETKVGLFTIIALLAVISLFLWLSGTQIFQKGNDIEAVFDHIEGLRPGATVQFAGVDIGRVSRIYFDDLQVVVVMHIQSGIKVPHPAKVLIASSGVIGDKFLEIIPTKPGELTSQGKRFIGQNPVTMDQFYSTAYDVLESLRTVADSLKYFITDPAITTSLKNALVRLDQITANVATMTDQLQNLNLAELFNRVNNIAIMIERMAQTNEPQLNEFMTNITKVTAQLAEASVTANRLLKDVDANGQTAVDLKQTLANADKISANLEKFTAVLANKDQNIEQLLQDAHETMQAIKAAAENVNKAVNQLSSGEGSLSQIKQTIAQASQAAEKVNNYVTAFEELSLKNSIGADYQKDSSLTVDYKMDLSINKQNSLLWGWDDIGQTNLASLQWAFKSPRFISRIGVYKSKFGLGLDLPVSSNLLFDFDVWDMHSPNMGLNSNWQISPAWSLSLGGQSNWDSKDNNWNVELWRNF